MDPRQVVRNDSGVMYCGQCGFHYDHTPSEVAHLSEEGFARLRDAVAATPESQRGIRPEPDVWSVNAYVAHLAEASGVVLERTRLILTQDNPLLAWYDESESVERNRMDDRPAGESLAELGSHVSQFVATMRMLDSSAWDRVGIHSTAGEVRLRDIAHDMAHELSHHAEDVQAIGVEHRAP